MIDVDLMSRRMSVSAVIAFLRDRHGEAAACKMARLEQLKARRARSRKRFDFWTAVATQMQQVRQFRARWSDVALGGTRPIACAARRVCRQRCQQRFP